jgi:ElaB/YqjD/DUF883 family membrane-anchored ribosome-binding protein
MSILAMKQALESLEVLLRDYGAVHDAGDLEMQPAFHQAHVAIEKLRQAIEQKEDAVTAEREACAKVCEEWLHGDWHNQGVVAAAMIRARGEK